jgi:hypothetical protein
VALLALAASCAQNGAEAPESQGVHGAPAEDEAAPVRPRGGQQLDAQALETFEGEVIAVERTPPRGRRGSGGVHLAVKTDDGTRTVLLGPAWYIDQQQPKIAVGDRIGVVGSATDDGDWVAARIEIGGKQLVLRDEAGVPAWSRGRRGR